MNSIKQLQNLILLKGGKLPNWGVDGDLGKETREAIDSLDLPKYIKIAMKEVGTKETPGSGDNPRIVEYHKTTSGKYSDDEVPWCGSFVNWVLKKAGYDITTPVPERAKSWLLFGEKITEPVIGSIAIKSRQGGGHVCFVIGKDEKGNLLCLGGNQSDEVNIKAYPPYVFEGFRLPLNVNKISLQTYSLSTGTTGKES